MNYYKDTEGNLYADPASIEGLEEVLSPVRADGSVLPNHKNIGQLALQEDGTRYPYYLDEPVDGVYQPDEWKIAETVIETNETDAKATRLTETDSNISVFGVDWQVDSTSLVDIKDAITTAQDMIDLGETPPETIMWTLANNKERETTLVELKQVKLAHALRKADIFSQYQAWRAGDKLSKFEVI